MLNKFGGIYVEIPKLTFLQLFTELFRKYFSLFRVNCSSICHMFRARSNKKKYTESSGEDDDSDRDPDFKETKDKGKESSSEEDIPSDDDVETGPRTPGGTPKRKRGRPAKNATPSVS